MQCNVCDVNIGSIVSNITLCAQCEECNPTELYFQILTNLREVEPNNRGYYVLKDKCGLLDLVIKKHSLSKISLCTFNPNDHDSDRTAMKYLNTYVRLEDNDNFQNHLPVTMSAFESDRFYRTFAMLCGLDIETGSKELRVRNIIDMAINAESYRSGASESQSPLESNDTWKDFLMQLIRENASVISFYICEIYLICFSFTDKWTRRFLYNSSSQHVQYNQCEHSIDLSRCSRP